MDLTKTSPRTATFMEGVHGISPVMDFKLSSIILQKASCMTGWNRKGKTGFPGSVLVPMDKNNINLLAEEEFVVGSKLDGTRYLLLIDGYQKAYFINRNGEVFHSPSVQFPSTASTIIEKTKHFSNTLLDGEMIFRKDENGISKPMYVIFDVICYQSENIRNEDFPKRLEKAKVIVGKRELAIDLGLIQPLDEPFDVESGVFYCAKDAGKVLKLQIPYETDGLVFVSTKKAYNYWPTIPGVNDHALKWKPGEKNTVDFQLRIKTDEMTGRRSGQLYVSELDVPFARMDLIPQLVDLDGKIIECSRQGGKWVFMRARWDREMPNSLVTANATMKSIEDAISEEELLDFIDKQCL